MAVSRELFEAPFFFVASHCATHLGDVDAHDIPSTIGDSFLGQGNFQTDFLYADFVGTIFDGIEIYAGFIVASAFLNFASIEFADYGNYVYGRVTLVNLNFLHEAGSQIFGFSRFTELAFDYFRNQLYGIGRGQSFLDGYATSGEVAVRVQEHLLYHIEAFDFSGRFLSGFAFLEVGPLHLSSIAQLTILFEHFLDSHCFRSSKLFRQQNLAGTYDAVPIHEGGHASKTTFLILSV